MFQHGIILDAVVMDRLVMDCFEFRHGRLPVVARADGVRFEAASSGLLGSLFGGSRKFSREPIVNNVECHIEDSKLKCLSDVDGDPFKALLRWDKVDQFSSRHQTPKCLVVGLS